MRSTHQTPLTLNPDRLFPADPTIRAIAQRLYAQVKGLPIISPHGHTDPQWFADDAPFSDPSSLLITPDHYVYRMLYSQGVPLEKLGVPDKDGKITEQNTRKIWQLFADNFYLFRGTPTRMWFDHVFYEIFGIRKQLNTETADTIYDHISDCLQKPEFRPRALFERFNIEVLATTESPLHSLEHHQKIRSSGWSGKVITAYRPDPVLDPEYEGFTDNVLKLGQITKEDTSTYAGYLNALFERRKYFITMGATSTDHGHPNAVTCNLSATAASALFKKALKGNMDAGDAEQFRGQMLTEMARMSIEDGLVMQLHPGSYRNHNSQLFKNFGRDKGADIPTSTEYVRALKPLLDLFGNNSNFILILFTLDESTYARELAPLAGHYPALKIGPPWWFYDSPEGMQRYRHQIIETAGFYNTVGFNDDTRAFMSIPARHDVARRMDCVFLAELVSEHRLDENEADELAMDLAYRLAKRNYKL